MIKPESLPAPHREKLRSVLENERLPEADRPRIEEGLREYEKWRGGLEADLYGAAPLENLVVRLDLYKRFIDLNLIFDSDGDFLHRQKGQLKLDNSVIEEFLPFAVAREFWGELDKQNLQLGPECCFSSLRFESTPLVVPNGAGMVIRTKDHDFALSRSVYLAASHRPDLSDAVKTETSIAYVAAECKTNLDKTMFQEAAATALDVKTAVPGARYYLLCEWLDMTPISAATTAIDEVILLRKSKRLASNVRAAFSTKAGRASARASYSNHLENHPFTVSAFRRFLDHVRAVVIQGSDDEGLVLERGYF